jgi:hypothetical protein
VLTLQIVSVQLRNQKWSGEAVGFFNATPQQLTDLRAGRWYMDVHTANHPNGEIRGQLMVLSLPLSLLGAPNLFSAFPISDERWPGANEMLPLEFRRVLNTVENDKWSNLRAVSFDLGPLFLNPVSPTARTGPYSR